jgi:F-box/WD-40 domain protein MET30
MFFLLLQPVLPTTMLPISSSQLSHLSDQLNEIIRIDPFSLLPREVNLRILGYLDAISLGRAAQVSKSWKALADDDLLWRRMCGQHIDRKCEKCGWGLPLLERRRLKVELKDFSPSAAIGIGSHDHDHDHDHEHEHEHSHEVSQLITRKEALGEMDKGKAAAHKTCDPVATDHGSSSSSSPISGFASTSTKRSADTAAIDAVAKRMRTEGSFSDSDDEKKLVKAMQPGPGALTREIRLTRPWKTVYCERLLVERNWRKGRCSTKTLKVSMILFCRLASG